MVKKFDQTIGYARGFVRRWFGTCTNRDTIPAVDIPQNGVLSPIIIHSILIHPVCVQRFVATTSIIPSFVFVFSRYSFDGVAPHVYFSLDHIDESGMVVCPFMQLFDISSWKYYVGVGHVGGWQVVAVDPTRRSPRTFFLLVLIFSFSLVLVPLEWM